MEFPVVDFPTYDNHATMNADGIEMTAESFRRHCLMVAAPTWANLEWLCPITRLSIVSIVSGTDFKSVPFPCKNLSSLSRVR